MRKYCGQGSTNLPLSLKMHVAVGTQRQVAYPIDSDEHKTAHGDVPFGSIKTHVRCARGMHRKFRKLVCV